MLLKKEEVIIPEIRKQEVADWSKKANTEAYSTAPDIQQIPALLIIGQNIFWILRSAGHTGIALESEI